MSEDPGTSTSENADPGVPEQDDGSVGTLLGVLISAGLWWAYFGQYPSARRAAPAMHPRRATSPPGA